MKFKDAVEQTPHLNGKWKAGLQALRPEDRPHVRPASPKKLAGSVDIDTAHQRLPAHASANRWDFAIGFQHTNRTEETIYWVETHTGSDSQIDVMLRKFEWLKTWLRGDGRRLAAFEGEYIWAPSGSTSFLKGAQQVRSLAMKGLKYAGSKGLVISDKHPMEKPA